MARERGSGGREREERERTRYASDAKDLKNRRFSFLQGQALG